MMSEKKPNLLRRLYNWVLHWAETPYGTPALAVNAFAESSFFPIPPDVLLIALSLGKPRKAWWYAFVCTLFSILGGIAGYYIGYALWESLGEPIVNFYNAQEIFRSLSAAFAKYSFWAVLIAALTPIPYKIFTIAAGAVAAYYFGLGNSIPHSELVTGLVFPASEIPLSHGLYFVTFLTASLAGRALRFFAVSGLIYFFGERVKGFIEKYFNLLSIAFVVLLIGGFYLISRLS